MCTPVFSVWNALEGLTLSPLCLCRYSSLRTNLPRYIMSFSDFPLTVETMGEHSHDHRV